MATPAKKVAKKATVRRKPSPVVSRPNIRPVTDMGLDYINGGIYAWPGAGKTSLLGTGGPDVCILDADRKGVTSAASQRSRAQGFEIADYEDLEEIYQWFRHGNGCEEFEVVCWDSVTLFQDATLIDDILEEAHTMNPAKQDPDVPSMREYLKSQTRIGRYIRRFCDLPIHFIATFHVTSFETPDGSILWAPLLQGGKNNEFSTKIHGYFNFLGYYYSKEKDGEESHYLRTRENHEYLAKDKFGVLPPVMKNPTLPQIVSAVEASRKGAKGKKKAKAKS